MSKTKPQIHVSNLSMVCGEAFRRRVIEGEIIPPGVRQLVGTGVHRSVDLNLAAKIEGRETPKEQIADTARDAFERGWSGGVRLESEEIERGPEAVKGEAIDTTITLSLLHHQDKAPEIMPVHVERAFCLEIPGYPFDLAGRMDIQEADAIRDTKTAAKTPPADAAEKSLQLTAYHLAAKVLDGREPSAVKLDYLVNTTKPKALTLSAERTAEDHQALLSRIEVLSKAMEAGVFLPVSPDHWACNPKWCGYALTCKYYTRRPVTNKSNGERL